MSDEPLLQAESVAFLSLAGELGDGMNVLAVNCDPGALAATAARVDSLTSSRLGKAEAGGYGLVVADLEIDTPDAVNAVSALARLTDAEHGIALVRIPNAEKFRAAREAFATEFPKHRIFRQHNWIASALLDDEMFAACEPGTTVEAAVRKTAGPPDDGELYTVFLASRGELPAPRTHVALTRSPELRKLTEELRTLRLSASAAAAESRAEQKIQAERIEELAEEIAWLDENALNLREKIEKRSWAMALLMLWRMFAITQRRFKSLLNR